MISIDACFPETAWKRVLADNRRRNYRALPAIDRQATHPRRGAADRRENIAKLPERMDVLSVVILQRSREIGLYNIPL